jgi:hypothetical protein
MFCPVILADIALPDPKDYKYLFEGSKKIQKDYSLYCIESFSTSAQTLVFGQTYRLDGVKPPTYIQNGEKDSDPQNCLRIWAVHKETKKVTDTLFFYSYYNEGSYGQNSVYSKLLLKKVSDNKIIYKSQKFKSSEMAAASVLPGNNNKIRFLVIMSFAGLLSLTALYFLRGRGKPKLAEF